ncbi:hypothetical protein [Geomesophilobacter sediminis]|uniref:DUF642 domain-containing protein n=1 Tax=Geomesophilobacter sediminis TaxID=2798584 RepID=A0A8J7J4Y8_9BACT|nr:hypothetical protein [Geomesophilobacter sediminis]MBJ6723326.1 hypothetical protein [Geomesophilobacter sediminis]
MTKIIACFCTVLLLAACGSSQNAAPSVAVVDISPAFFNYTSSAVLSAAKAGLPFWVGTIGNEWADFGFQSQDEVAFAQLGGPYPVFVLKNAGKSNQSIAATDQWEFPVTANDQYRCMLTMDKINGEWVTASIGSAGYAKALQTTENTHPGLSIKNKAILRVFGFSCGYYDILAINLSDPQPSFLMVGSATSFVNKLPQYAAWVNTDPVPVLTLDDLYTIFSKM